MNKFLISYFLFLISYYSFSQWNDAGLWTSASVEKKITQTLSANFSEAFRFNENISELGSFFSEFGIEKKISKNLRASINYRFSSKRGIDDIYSQRYRYFVDLNFRKKISKIVVNYRARIQSQIKNNFSRENISNPENHWRNKISLRYNLEKKYQPFISGEWWYPLNNPKQKYFDNLRCAAGLQYEINKMSSVELYYMIQKELHKNNPETDFILGIGYNFSF